MPQSPPQAEIASPRGTAAAGGEPPAPAEAAALAAAAVAGFVAGLDTRRLQRCAEGAGLGAVDGRRGQMERRVVQHLLPDVASTLEALAGTPLPALQVG